GVHRVLLHDLGATGLLLLDVDVEVAAADSAFVGVDLAHEASPSLTLGNLFSAAMSAYVPSFAASCVARASSRMIRLPCSSSSQVQRGTYPSSLSNHATTRVCCTSTLA